MKIVVNSIAYVISRVIYLKNCLVWEKPAHPGRVIWIKPVQIERSIEFSKIVKHRRNYLDGIIAEGRWGKKQLKIDKHFPSLLKSFDQHFNNNIPFEKTEYFKNLKNSSARLLAKKYSIKYDSIYQQIKAEGFKIPTSIFDNIDHFKVSIASNGDILFMTGKHRLAIAIAIDENYPIPARVSHRHAEWQKYRDKLFIDLKEGEIDKDYILKLNHPDLYDLIE